MESKLTILFEAPFWVGLYERVDNGSYEACKITFGAEPTDAEIYVFLLQHWGKLQFSPPVKTDIADRRHRNPKRIQREIHREVQSREIGTKAQRALQQQHEQSKLQRRTKKQERREAEKQRRFALRQEKKKAKHRGR